jgi:hypothetical protein
MLQCSIPCQTGAKMGFEEWKTLASAALSELHGIDPSRISEQVWRQLYIDNYAPRDAAEACRHVSHQHSHAALAAPPA